jgi:endopeptidase La
MVTLQRAPFATRKPNPLGGAPLPDAKATNTEAVTPKKRGRKPKAAADAATSVTEEAKLEENPKPKLIKLYTLKFNSPILPFAKFPLTQNKYIQDFLRKYEEDKEHV